MAVFRRFSAILLVFALLCACGVPGGTAAPEQSAAASSAQSEASASQSETSSSLPESSSSLPESSSLLPEPSSSLPESSSLLPEPSSSPPEISSSLPETSSSLPDSSSAAESSAASAAQPPRATKDTWVLPEGYEGLDADEYADAAEEIFDGINAIRENNGLPALRRSGILDCSATMRAADLEDCSEEQFYAHLRPDGARWSTAFDELGITFWSSRGENLGMVKFNDHAEDWQMMVDAWEDSPDHFENIITESFTEIGIGIYCTSSGRYYLCTHFASFA